MTHDEAAGMLAKLKQLLSEYCGLNKNGIRAFDMAISALEAQDGDCISRQSAIMALSNMMDTDGFRDGWAVSRANVECMLNSLPSVQPEIIRCRECKYFGYYECKNHGNNWHRSGDGFCDRAERKEE